MLTELRTYIIENSDYFTTSNVFIDKLPDSPVEAIMLTRSSGGDVSEGRSVKKTPVTIIIRHGDYSIIELWGEEFRKLLHNKSHISDKIKYIYLLEDLAQTDVTDKGDLIYSITFLIQTMVEV